MPLRSEARNPLHFGLGAFTDPPRRVYYAACQYPLRTSLYLAELGRILDPIRCSLTPLAAREVTGLRADPTTQARLEELAVKCMQARLTEVEQAEYDTYVKSPGSWRETPAYFGSQRR